MSASRSSSSTATAHISWTVKNAGSYAYWLHFRDGRDTEGPFDSYADAWAYALDIGDDIPDGSYPRERLPERHRSHLSVTPAAIGQEISR